MPCAIPSSGFGAPGQADALIVWDPENPRERTSLQFRACNGFMGERSLSRDNIFTFTKENKIDEYDDDLTEGVGHPMNLDGVIKQINYNDDLDNDFGHSCGMFDDLVERWKKTGYSRSWWGHRL